MRSANHDLSPKPDCLSLEYDRLFHANIRILILMARQTLIGE
jgi:hypothetical protein